MLLSLSMRYQPLTGVKELAAGHVIISCEAALIIQTQAFCLEKISRLGHIQLSPLSSKNKNPYLRVLV